MHSPSPTKDAIANKYSLSNLWREWSTLFCNRNYHQHHHHKHRPSFDYCHGFFCSASVNLYMNERNRQYSIKKFNKNKQRTRKNRTNNHNPNNNGNNIIESEYKQSVLSFVFGPARFHYKKGLTTSCNNLSKY